MPKSNKAKSMRARSIAMFTIEGQGLDLEGISRSLGLAPSSTHRKGEPIFQAGKRKYLHDQWSLEVPLDKLEPLDAHLKWLNQQLEPHREFIKSLKADAEVYIYCGYTFHNYESAFTLSPESLTIFTELSIPMEVNLLIG